jgi:hypothetical protein
MIGQAGTTKQRSLQAVVEIVAYFGGSEAGGTASSVKTNSNYYTTRSTLPSRLPLDLGLSQIKRGPGGRVAD